jgi:hypothetical protein
MPRRPYPYSVSDNSRDLAPFTRIREEQRHSRQTCPSRRGSWLYARGTGGEPLFVAAYKRGGDWISCLSGFYPEIYELVFSHFRLRAKDRLTLKGLSGVFASSFHSPKWMNRLEGVRFRVVSHAFVKIIHKHAPHVRGCSRTEIRGSLVPRAMQCVT